MRDGGTVSQVCAIPNGALLVFGVVVLGGLYLAFRLRNQPNALLISILVIGISGGLGWILALIVTYSVGMCGPEYALSHQNSTMGFRHG